MAIFYACDACGEKMEEGPALTAGLVVVRQYCEKCAPDVRQYQKDRDELHEEVAHAWAVRSDLLRVSWLKKHPNGQLPDML